MCFKVYHAFHREGGKPSEYPRAKMIHFVHTLATQGDTGNIFHGSIYNAKHRADSL